MVGLQFWVGHLRKLAEHLPGGLGIIVGQKVVTGLVDFFRLGRIEQHVFLPFPVLRQSDH